MRILLTNDDGIDAKGLSVLTEIARQFGDVTIVAPKEHHSGCSHQLTWEGHIGVHQLEDGRFWVDGYPADCVRLAIAQLCPKIDLVISGINHGGNLGLDVFLSGTVAAAREAAFIGLPAIAISQYHRGLTDEAWAKSRRMAERAIKFLLSDKMSPGTLWSVNLPALDPDVEVSDAFPHIRRCPLDREPLPLSYQKNSSGYDYVGDYHDRPYAVGTDVDLCFGGSIAITELDC